MKDYWVVIGLRPEWLLRADKPHEVVVHAVLAARHRASRELSLPYERLRVVRVEQRVRPGDANELRFQFAERDPTEADMLMLALLGGEL